MTTARPASTVKRVCAAIRSSSILVSSSPTRPARKTFAAASDWVRDPTMCNVAGRLRGWLSLELLGPRALELKRWRTAGSGPDEGSGQRGTRDCALRARPRAGRRCTSGRARAAEPDEGRAGPPRRSLVWSLWRRSRRLGDRQQDAGRWCSRPWPAGAPAARASPARSADTGRMTRLAVHDLPWRSPVPGAATRSARWPAAVQVFKDDLIRAQALEEETALARAAPRRSARRRMREMADGFEAAVGGIIGDGLGGVRGELQATAQTMTARPAETASQSTAVASGGRTGGRQRQHGGGGGRGTRFLGRRRSAGRSRARPTSPGAVDEAGRTAHLVQELSAPRPGSATWSG